MLLVCQRLAGAGTTAIVPGTLIAALEPGEPLRLGVVTIAAQTKPSVFGTDIQLKPNSFGGPVIDRHGHVVGIVIDCQSEVGGFGQSHVIPASVARRVVADWPAQLSRDLHGFSDASSNHPLMTLTAASKSHAFDRTGSDPGKAADFSE